MLKELKKEITINFGKPCKTKSCLCACCVAWSAYNTLEELFSLKTK